jgi:hypothetical protein
MQKGKFPSKKLKDGVCTVHAEVDALLKVSNREDLRGATVYVIRVNKQGQLAMSQPCPMCSEILREHGIKRAFFTVSENENAYGVLPENLRAHGAGLRHCELPLIVYSNNVHSGPAKVLTVGNLEESIHFGMNRANTVLQLLAGKLTLLHGRPAMPIETHSQNLGTLCHQSTVAKPHFGVEIVIPSKLPCGFKESLHESVLSLN